MHTTRSDSVIWDSGAIDAAHCCRTSNKGDGAPWTALPLEVPERAHDDVDQNWMERECALPSTPSPCPSYYFYSIQIRYSLIISMQSDCEIMLI